MINRIEKKLENKLIPCAVIAVLALIVYSNSFTAPYHLDDYGSIVNNYSIRNPLDLLEIWKFYSNRFVLYFTLSINYAIHGNDVIGYHITNLAIHIFSGIIFFFIMYYILGLEHFSRKVSGKYRNVISVISALIFVCHPMQVNAVTYMVQRTASLAGAFYLLAVLFYIKFRIQDKTKHYALMMFFTVLAMFTKENTITIPFMLLAIELLFFLKDGKTHWWKRIVFLLVIFLTIPIIPGTNLLLKGYSQSDPDVTFKASTSMDRFQYFYTQMNVIILYIKLLFIPDRQNFDYSNDFPMSHTIWENHSYLSLIILAIIFLFGVLNIRKNKLIALGIIWFFISISVESSFISIKDVYFEHRLYVAVAGFIMCLAGIMFIEVKKDRIPFLIKRPLLYFLTASILMIALYSGLTLKRNYVYSDGIRLWTDVVEKAPESDRAHSILGGDYLESYENDNLKNKEHLNVAEKELKKAVELNRNNDTAHCNLAKVYLLQDRYDLCIEEANKTNAITPSTYAYNNMGLAYKKQGKTDKALQAFMEGYKLDKKCTFLLENIGDMYYEAHDLKNAEFYYREYQKNSTYKSDKIQKKLDEINNSHVSDTAASK